MPKLPVPYPPGPADVPDGLTDFAPSYRSQQRLLLAGLFGFLALYLGLIALSAVVGVWCLVTLKELPALKFAGLALSGLLFLFLVKGFFKRHSVEKDAHLEITEDDQPVLFAFIRRLCDEVGAPEPNRVFVSPDVKPRSSSAPAS